MNPPCLLLPIQRKERRLEMGPRGNETGTPGEETDTAPQQNAEARGNPEDPRWVRNSCGGGDRSCFCHKGQETRHCVDSSRRGTFFWVLALSVHVRGVEWPSSQRDRVRRWQVLNGNANRQNWRGALGRTLPKNPALPHRYAVPEQFCLTRCSRSTEKGLAQLNLRMVCVTPCDKPSLTLHPLFSDAIPGDRDTPATQSQLAISAILPSSMETKLLA
ncbi:uncharacterized protein LOC122237006 isoform X1 [Panthera tigris]|uniref:uncharacterized protein LOC122237006 isoform X1 n=1 Tax=Panthera tigris TaxID=9694 RepID=UPI001C6F6FFB|nr:uncharacterized protein LOC122237006 isoform X1 [Panthera tigris]